MTTHIYHIFDAINFNKQYALLGKEKCIPTVFTTQYAASKRGVCRRSSVQLYENKSYNKTKNTCILRDY